MNILKNRTQNLRSIVQSLVLLVALPMPAWAGNLGSGGGRAVVCTAPNGEILSAESLDIYEGRVAFQDKHLNLRSTAHQAADKPKSSVDQYLEVASDRLSKSAYSLLTGTLSIQKSIVHVHDHLRFLEEGAGLQVIPDSEEFVVPQKGCQVAQAASFVDPENIFFVKEIWDKMSDLSKAALVIHEAVYWKDRVDMGLRDSKRSRRAVSASLGEIWNHSDYRTGLPAKLLTCHSLHLPEDGPVSVFVVYERGGKQFSRFASLQGQRVLGIVESPFLSPFPSFLPSSTSLSETFPLLLKSPGELGQLVYLNLASNHQGQIWEHNLTLSGERIQYPNWKMQNEVISCNFSKAQ